MADSASKLPARLVLILCLAGAALLAVVSLMSSQKDSNAPAIPTQDGRVLAMINGELVYQRDLEAFQTLSNLTQETESLDVDAVLDQLIDRRLLSQSAQARGLETTPQTAARLSAARDGILADALIAQIMEDPIPEADIQALYDAQAGIRQRGFETRARQILLPDLETAQEVVAKLQSGDSFQSLAIAYSLDRVSRDTGGDLGYFTRDSYPKTFSDKVFETAVGERAAPFQTDRGWHVLEVLDRRRVPTPSFDDMRDELETFLRQKRLQDLLNQLRSEANIDRIQSEPGSTP